MDRFLGAMLAGLLFAVPWGIGAALFGGAARVVARHWRRTPEDCPTHAFHVGFKRGAKFGVGAGLTWGLIIGYCEGLVVGVLFEHAVISCIVFGGVAILAVLIGSLGYALEWFGVSDRGRPPQENVTCNIDAE